MVPLNKWPPGEGEMVERIRRHEWSRTSLGPVDGWPEILKSAVALVLDNPLPAALAWGSELVTIYNDGFARLHGPGQALGLPLAEVEGEAWERVRPIAARVLAGEPAALDDHLIALEWNGKTERACFTFTCSPFRSGLGEVLGVLVTAVETPRNRGELHDGPDQPFEASLWESEERVRMVLEAGRMGTWRHHLATGAQEWSDQQFRLFGLEPGEQAPSRDLFMSLVHPDDHHIVEFGPEDLLPGRGFLDSEFRIIRPDGKLRWLVAHTVVRRAANGEPTEMIGLNWDITERKQAEATLRESEERQAFLLRLSDAMRPLADVRETRATGCRMLAEQLGADRVYYLDYHTEAGYGLVAGDYSADGLPSVAGRYPFEAFRATYERISNGVTWVVEDVADDRQITPPERDYYAAQQVMAWVDVPLLRGGRLAGVLCVVQTRPRNWTRHEIELVEDVADRLWGAFEQGRAEEALRKSEERFRQFGEASQDVLWIRDAETLRWVYLTPAFEVIYGIGREQAMGPLDFQTWIELVVPEDRKRAVASIERVRAGEDVIFEYRIRRPSDGQIRWLRNTDFPITDEDGRVSLIGGIGHDITSVNEAEEHQKLLLSELQHRVRNTLAVIRSITRRTAVTTDSKDEFFMHLDGRIDAFSRVQAAVTRDPLKGVDLAFLVAEELRVVGAQEGHGLKIQGPPISLAPKAAETFGLAIHELATNAIKYGALSNSHGTIAVSWEVVENGEDRKLRFDWTERGVTAMGSEPRRRGFGTEILERSLGYELKADTTLAFGPDGIRCRIVLPLDLISANGTGRAASGAPAW